MFQELSIGRRSTEVDLPAHLTKYRGVAAALDLGKVGNEHDRLSRSRLLTEIADFLHVPVEAPMSDGQAARDNVLIVPSEAVTASTQPPQRHPEILGGRVPAAFIATKAITHGLVDADATQPQGWSVRMSELMGDAALDGFTAFSIVDAKRAGRRLLAKGSVRIKDVCGKAGLGQLVVRDDAALDAALDGEDPAVLSQCGIVLEANLNDVATYSVGTVMLAERQISYWGSQNLTRDHHGREVYGGSDLFVVRGGWDALRRLELPAALARAIECAVIFDTAAHEVYPDIELTRRNYDVIEGTDYLGQNRIGVLEQSWRVGGATGAEIAALKALEADPELESVRCSTVEVYDLVEPPLGATLYYRGIDPRVGPMTKYAMRLM